MALEDRGRYQEACSRCSQCKFVPMPESQAFSSICPSIDYGRFHAYSGGGKVITSYALRVNLVQVTSATIDSVYACTMCGACDTACKTNMGEEVEPLDTLYALRAHLAAENNLPQPLLDLIDRLRKDGSHLGSSSERDLWSEGLQIVDATQQKVDVLLHVGGENAFDRKRWPQLWRLVQMLQAADVKFGIAFGSERDAGDLAYDLGFQEDARALAAHQQEILRRSGARTLLCADANAYAAFRGLYPRMDHALEPVRVVHAAEFVDELIESRRLTLASAEPIKVTYHDPCRLGRLSEPYQAWSGQHIKVLNTMTVPDSTRPVRFGTKGQYAAPRRLLQRLAGVELVEMERNREFSYCCGAGGGTAQAYPEMAQAAALSRLAEARATGAACLVTACAGCQRHLSAVAAEHDIDIEVRGIFDLITHAT